MAFCDVCLHVPNEDFRKNVGGSFASPNDAASGFSLGRTPHINALGSGGLHEGLGCVVLALKLFRWGSGESFPIETAARPGVRRL